MERGSLPRSACVEYVFLAEDVEGIEITVSSSFVVVGLILAVVWILSPEPAVFFLGGETDGVGDIECAVA